MKQQWHPQAFKHRRQLWRWLGLLSLIALLAACRTTPTSPESAPAGEVPAPATASPAPLVPSATAAPPTATPIPPTPTPDVALLPEQYEHPQGVFRIRYPAGWSAEELSSDGEVLVSFRGPVDQGEAIFMVNLVNPGGQLTEEQVPALTQSYLDNFFQEQVDLVTLSQDTLPDGTSRVTAVGPGDSPDQQLHLEFRFAQQAPLFQTLIMLSSEAAWPAAEPLLSGMANSFQIGEAAATALPTPALGGNTAVEGLDVVSGNYFTAGSGSLYFVGEVQNSTDQAYQEVEVTVYLLDSSGTILAQETWGTSTSLLQPNATAPVAVIFDNPPAGWTDLRTEVSANPADFYLDYVYSDLELQQVVSDTTSFGDYRLSGAVLNTGEAATRFVEVIGTLYDAEGRVLAVESTVLAQELLEPGGTAPFELVFYSKAEGEVDRHELVVQGVTVEEQPQEQGAN